MPKFEKALSALSSFVRVLEANRTGALLFIVIQSIAMLSIYIWRK
jgi:hypothetical protein